MIRERIKKRMEELGLNAGLVSRQAQLGATAVHDIISGKNKSPSVPHLSRIAKVLDCDLGYLIGDQDYIRMQPQILGAEAIAVAGYAEAGAFRVMPEVWHEGDHELPRIYAPRSKTFPRAKHFALQVRGDSMNAARPSPISEGTYVLCVDLVDADLAVESGRIYAVRQTRDSGQTWEITVKRAKVYRDRVELVPESLNPVHQTLVIRNTRDASDHHTIEAFGLVYGTFNSFEA